MSVQIPISRGLFATIDECDLDLVARHKWSANRANQSAEIYYVRSSQGIYLHRFILSVPPRVEVDHIDRNPLNNVRANLRMATHSQNCANGNMRRAGANRFRGTYLAPDRKRFYSRISVQGRMICLGTFTNEIDAAMAYDAAAIKHFGEFAQPNFPESNSTPSSEKAA